MKPFNLEEYLKNPSKKVVTRAGSKARIICTNANSEYPIVALVERYDYDETFTYTKDGCYFSIGSPSQLDLFFASEKHEGWLNIYRSDECGFYMRGTSPYKSKDEADKVAKANPKTFFTTVKVEWEE